MLPCITHVDYAVFCLLSILILVTFFDALHAQQKLCMKVVVLVLIVNSLTFQKTFCFLINLHSSKASDYLKHLTKSN